MKKMLKFFLMLCSFFLIPATVYAGVNPSGSDYSQYGYMIKNMFGNTSGVAAAGLIPPLPYFLATFAMFSYGLISITPEKSNDHQKSVGLILIISGLSIIFLTYRTPALIGLFGFFFAVLGFMKIFAYLERALGGVATLIGSISLINGFYFILNRYIIGESMSIFYFITTIMLFFSMIFTGFLMSAKGKAVGVVFEKITGMLLLFTSLFSFALPAVLVFINFRF